MNIGEETLITLVDNRKEKKKTYREKVMKKNRADNCFSDIKVYSLINTYRLWWLKYIKISLSQFVTWFCVSCYYIDMFTKRIKEK